MRIALVAPPWFPVPPPAYGGIEAVVALLADGLVQAGHDVTLFASGGSKSKATICSAFEEPPSQWIGNAVHELWHVLDCVADADEFDIVHDHTSPLGLALGGLTSTPWVHTVHAAADEIGGLYGRICNVLPICRLISISRKQQELQPSLPWTANCPNAIDFDAYPVAESRGDYLVFLGRMAHEKGAHRAIEVARATGLPLKIAAKKREPAEERYFDAYVRPHLSSRIEYVGEVDHREKVELLRGALATLFPISWEEPFGLVMVESMACGTPVVASRRGSVPEVVEPGLTGAIVDHHSEMAAVLDGVTRLDRRSIREVAERRFGRDRLLADHLAAYERVLDGEVALLGRERTRLNARESRAKAKNRFRVQLRDA